ncbi:hypothetical protein C8R46DRAFT_1331124 [Mycena filopes]|nr:hypothetical protein C8R46DRAFT_1331124 [Mycena filopes]
MECRCQRRSNSRSARAGDACFLRHTSVEKPFMEMILDSLRALPTTEVAEGGPHDQHYDELLTQAQIRYDELKNPKNRKGKPRRPCVLLPPRERGGDLRVCLLATFDKKAPSKWPQIHRDFAHPVVPNPGIPSFLLKDDRNPDLPLDTYPSSYFEPTQWVVAIAMQPRGKAARLPKWRRSRPVHFCDEAVYALQESCLQKKTQWERNVEARKEIPGEYFKELQMTKVSSNNEFGVDENMSYRSSNMQSIQTSYTQSIRSTDTTSTCFSYATGASGHRVPMMSISSAATYHTDNGDIHSLKELGPISGNHGTPPMTGSFWIAQSPAHTDDGLKTDVRSVAVKAARSAVARRQFAPTQGQGLSTITETEETDVLVNMTALKIVHANVEFQVVALNRGKAVRSVLSKANYGEDGSRRPAKKYQWSRNSSW